MSLTHRERAAIDKSALFIVFVTPEWLRDDNFQAQAQARYAQRQGKPFRVLVYPGARLPEDSFTGVVDLQVAHLPSREPDATVRQIRTWVEEMRP